MFLKNGYQTMILLYSTFNEGKSVVTERFIRILKNKLYKHMASIGKNVYYDVLDDIVNEYNNTKHSTINMKPKDVKNDTAELNSLEPTTKSSAIARNKRVHIDEHNEKSARYNVGDIVRISTFKNIFVLQTCYLATLSMSKHTHLEYFELNSELNFEIIVESIQNSQEVHLDQKIKAV